jgi:DHA2 family multidrug resistance protein
MTSPAPEAPVISAPRKWAITITVMVVAFMQILDTSVTNVILPHLQGSLSAGLDEVSWVITSYLAANAVIIPATGWLAGLFGRRRFFLICATLFVVSSFISGAAPDLTTLIVARIFQGLGGGPIIPLSQAILWEIFPFHQRGLAMAVWGLGFIFGPILGPTVGGYLADQWSWRWIFTSTCPSASSASSWRASFCSIRRTCVARRGSTGGASASWSPASAVCSSCSTAVSAKTGSTRARSSH